MASENIDMKEWESALEEGKLVYGVTDGSGKFLPFTIMVTGDNKTREKLLVMCLGNGFNGVQAPFNIPIPQKLLLELELVLDYVSKRVPLMMEVGTAEAKLKEIRKDLLNANILSDINREPVLEHEDRIQMNFMFQSSQGKFGIAFIIGIYATLDKTKELFGLYISVFDLSEGNKCVYEFCIEYFQTFLLNLKRLKHQYID